MGRIIHSALLNSRNLIGDYDPDAQAFFDEGVSDGQAELSAGIKTAVNNYIIALKAASIWSNVGILFIYVGGTAGWHRISIKNPTTNKLTFNGGWTHDSGGALPNGSTGYASSAYDPGSGMGQVIVLKAAAEPGTGGLIHLATNDGTNTFRFVVKHTTAEGKINTSATITHTGTALTSAYNYLRGDVPGNELQYYKNTSEDETLSPVTGDSIDTGTLEIGRYNSEYTNRKLEITGIITATISIADFHAANTALLDALGRSL